MCQMEFSDRWLKVWPPSPDVGEPLNTLEGVPKRRQVSDLLLFSLDMVRISQDIGNVILRLRQDDELST